MKLHSMTSSLLCLFNTVTGKVIFATIPKMRTFQF